MSPAIAIVLKGYPRLSETFIAQEIRALELRGFKLILFSLRFPTDDRFHPIHAEIEAPVHYLPEYVFDDVGRVLKSWWRIRRQPGYRQAFRIFIRDFWRDFTSNRVRRFAQAIVLADEIPESVQHYYAHFMHTPASVTYYASLIKQKSWSISAHAKDIWTIPNWEKKEKMASVDWIVTCTAANARHLSELAVQKDKVVLLYHGLDFQRFPEMTASRSMNDGSDEDLPVQLISVGRAVDKKGYEYLLEALFNLPKQLHWRFTHIGGGELLDELKAKARALKIDDYIEWRGALPQTDVLAAYRQADLFVLPSKISSNGDRDGLPNVLMEAQSQQLACLSTDISGIPELIQHDETGWLVPQQDPLALEHALYHLITQPELRHRLATAGLQRVHAYFSLDHGINLLETKLNQSLSRALRSCV
jgi:glycosyltransferase involved in cell wall biosynthesis